MESDRGFHSLRRLALISLCLVLIAAGFAPPARSANAQDQEPAYTTQFYLEDCNGFRSRGVNPYFILRPGYQLVFEGEEDGESLSLVITVLHEMKTVHVPGLGEITTRVVEEVERADGELVEVSRNYFAICKRTNDVYYFGEAVDIYEGGEIVSHEGAWEAGQPDEDGLAEPGLIMPGTFLLGSRYFQEIAEGIALDRAEHIAMGLEVTVPAGTFTDCVEVLETTPLEPDAETTKIYCRGVGLVIDDVLELVSYGFVNRGGQDAEDDDE
jgi:hypothetical protein